MKEIAEPKGWVDLWDTTYFEDMPYFTGNTFSDIKNHIEQIYPQLYNL